MTTGIVLNGRHRSLRSTVAGAARTAAIAVSLVAALAGCGKKPAPASKADEALFHNIARVQARADSVFSMRDTLKVVRGKWSGPGSAATYEAYRDGEIYRFIEEKDDRGEFGSSDNRYYYDPSGLLFYYEDRGEEKEPRGALPPMSRLVQRTLIVNPQGRATWGRRLVDGVPNVVPDSQVTAILDRSRGVLASAKGMVP